MIVETDCRVFEITMHPETPGHMRRTITVRMLSGEPMTEREAKTVGAALIACYEQQGGTVHKIAYEE